MSAHIAATTSTAVLKGIALYAFGVFLLSVMDAVIKWLTADYPVQEIVFFRSVFGMVAPAILLWREGSLAALATRRPLAHLFRGLIAVVATFAFFYSFAVLPLADVYAIGFAAPIFITALSVPILAEAVGVRRWIAVVVGFLGVVVMLRPGQAGIEGFFSAGAMAALLGTVCYALSMTLVRLYSRTETNVAMVVWSGLVVVVASSISLLWGWTMPDLHDFALLAGVGLLGGLGSLVMTQAFRTVQTSIIAPFEYTGMIWGVLFGWLIWNELPDAWIVSGCAIVMSSGLYILHREAIRSQAPSPVAPADRLPERTST